MRASGLRGFHFQHDARDFLLGDDGAAFIADPLRAGLLSHFHQAAAAVGAKVGVGDEGEGLAQSALQAAT